MPFSAGVRVGRMQGESAIPEIPPGEATGIRESRYRTTASARSYDGVQSAIRTIPEPRHPSKGFGGRISGPGFMQQFFRNGLR